MLFNSLTFWVFFPVFFASYFLTSGRTRLWVCLLGSYLFYGWWDWRFLGLIGLLTGLNYWFGLKIADSPDDRSGSKLHVTLSVATSLAILGFFKYFNFFVDSFAALSNAAGLNFSASTIGILLPVGISFYTFQTMSYTIDLYRKEVAVEKSLLKFAVFVSFFPQLVAGPIVRARDFLPQLQKDQTVEWARIQSGINLVLWGMVLKVVMADNLAVTVDKAFGSPEASSGLYLAIGTLFYAFQIYGDFAGYSLMAIGFARMLGFDFDRNFDRPYFSRSFSEFWKRWHISLSSWLRDYLYIPLGGSRCGKTRTKINLMLTMLLGGLWHGAAWTFVIWGGLHGTYLVLQRANFTWLTNNLPRLINSLFAWCVTFSLVLLAWIFFRAQSLDEALLIIEKIVTLDRFHPSTILKLFFVAKGALIIALVFSVEFSSFRVNYPDLAQRYPSLNIIFAVSCLLVIALAGMFSGGAFIYFQF